MSTNTDARIIDHATIAAGLRIILAELDLDPDTATVTEAVEEIRALRSGGKEADPVDAVIAGSVDGITWDTGRSLLIVELEDPLTGGILGDVVISRLELRRANAKDLREATRSGDGNAIATLLAMIGRLSGQADRAIELLCSDDITRMGQYAIPFASASLRRISAALAK